ncbi:helix-turn-helix domain-containing protein [Leuconostoc citreum]|uniref:helix-turn-helix domain-containing protein n=1 Tax=Leuconostoc citreum TaxID=33964 RepID=UPI00200B06EA|nr:helix-turn-helix domain-containing protein [Leuconostoc citreum]MCK8605073.1 helix-turn-helix domain-containing protein [Leuconostoc citreum]
MSVGEFIRNRREELGLSLRQLSKLTNLSENRLFRIEHDRTKIYAFEENRLSQGLYLSVSDIMVTVEKSDKEEVSFADKLMYQRLKERIGEHDGSN